MRVGVAPNYGCGVCDICTSGNTHMCRSSEGLGVSVDGGFAEFMRTPSAAVRQGNVTQIADTLLFEDAAMAEPLSRVFNAYEKIGIYPGDHVLVIGAGPIGLMHLRMAGLAGAASVYVTDLSEERLLPAKKLVPEVTVLTSDNLEEEISEYTGGRLMNLVITAASVPAIQEAAFRYIGLNGRVMFFGGLPNGKSIVNLDTNEIHYKQLTVAGTTRQSLRQYRTCLKLLESGSLVVSDSSGACLVTSFIPSQLYQPEPGITEENPEFQLDSVCRTIAECLSSPGMDASRIRCLAIDGQMAGVIGIGNAGMAVTPYDSLLDTRCASYIREMKSRGEDEIIRKTGNPPSFNHGPKILWWMKEQPETYEGIASFVQPGGYAAMRLCGLSARDKNDPERFADLESEEFNPGTNDPIFIPHMAGRVSPSQPDMKGTFTGLSWKHGRTQLFRSILESVAFVYGVYRKSLRTMLPDAEISELRITGGGEKSRLWNLMKSSVLQVPVVPIDRSYGAPMGATIVAVIASGLYSSAHETADNWILLQSSIEADSGLWSFFERRVEKYQSPLEIVNQYCS